MCPVGGPLEIGLNPATSNSDKFLHIRFKTIINHPNHHHFRKQKLNFAVFLLGFILSDYWM